MRTPFSARYRLWPPEKLTGTIGTSIHARHCTTTRSIFLKTVERKQSKDATLEFWRSYYQSADLETINPVPSVCIFSSTIRNVKINSINSVGEIRLRLAKQRSLYVKEVK